MYSTASGFATAVGIGKYRVALRYMHFISSISGLSVLKSAFIDSVCCWFRVIPFQTTLCVLDSRI